MILEETLKSDYALYLDRLRKAYNEYNLEAFRSFYGIYFDLYTILEQRGLDLKKSRQEVLDMGNKLGYNILKKNNGR